MNIKANMRVDFDSFKNTTTVATGWVEIEGIFKFPVSVRKDGLTISPAKK